MPDDERQHAEVAGSKSGDQFVPVKKSTIETSLEELERRHEQRDDDPDRRRDRDERAEGEDALDDVLAEAPAPGAELEPRARGQLGIDAN